MAAATKTARPRKTTGGPAKVAPVVVRGGPDDVPEELRDFYGPPKLSRDRGAGTTAADPGEFNFDTSTPVAKVEVERLFSIDGKPYFIPVEFPPAYGIVYLDALDRGRDVAVAEALKLAIGPKGWTALRDLAKTRPDLIDPAQFEALMNKVLAKVLGAVENGEGNG